MAEKKRGRPVKKSARGRYVNVRIDADEYAMIDRLREVTGLSTSKILRAALQLYYHMTVK